MESATCQVWWAAPGLVQPWHADLLTPAEQSRVARLRREPDRNRLIVGNALLRLAVRSWIDEAPVIDRTCPDCAEPHGKPLVVGHDVHVSVSHSGERIAVALTRTAPIGIDVEEITDREVDEVRRMVEAPNDPRDMGFFDLWTRKEAVLKALGDGLRTPMTSIALTADGVAGRECVVTTLQPGPGYAAALAVLTTQPLDVSEVDGASLLL